MNRIAGYYGLALGLSLALTPLCRAIAHRLGLVARPTEDRWHKRPTALFGGVAIAVVTLALGTTLGMDPRLWQLMACGFAVAAFGLVDDVMSLKASTKLIVQVDRRIGPLVLRLSASLDRVLDSGRDAHAVLDCRYHQRLQPAGQHGRPVRRHHGDRRRLSARRRCMHRERRPRPRVYLAGAAWRHAGFCSTTFTRPQSSWVTRAAFFWA